MLDHWMPGLFQTHLGQCLGSGWQQAPRGSFLLDATA